MTAVDAVLASAAAPTFFAEATVDGPIATGRYIDGGLWANNPVLPAIAEAVGHLGTSPDRIDVLSVGTMATTHDFHLVPFCEELNVLVEIGEQDIFSEVLKLLTRIPGKPVFDNFFFCFHPCRFSCKCKLFRPNRGKRKPLVYMM